MDKKKIIWITVSVIGLLVIGAGGLFGYRIYTRSQADFRSGPRRGLEGEFGGGRLIEGERAFGEVESFNDGELTIITLEGEQFSFALNVDTQFISPDSSLTSLDDLKIGLEINVTYEVQANDELHALVIGAGQGPQRGRGAE